jgi:serine/threonine protein kinase
VADERSSTRARPGATLGDRFRLERVIGTGGMASVWLGHDEQLDRPVAVKILSEALAEDERFVERFSREARIAAGVSHPNLVNVYDFDATGRRPYLVMEYIEGPTLGALIESAPERLEPERIARELLAALRHIHDAGIVHRDVKPQNVLVGADGRTRLTDFGIARPDEASGLTTTGQVLGTFRYLAPELRVGEPATVRSDLYSAGILLRECLPEGATGGLVLLAERMSAPDPADRPASAAVALSEVEETGVLYAAPPPAAPPGPETDEIAREPVTTPAAAETEVLLGELPPPPPELPPPPRLRRLPRVRMTPRRFAIAAIAGLGAIVAVAAALQADNGRPVLVPLADKREIRRVEQRREHPLILIPPAVSSEPRGPSSGSPPPG